MPNELVKASAGRVAPTSGPMLPAIIADAGERAGKGIGYKQCMEANMTQEQRTDIWLPMETAPRDGTRFIAWSKWNGYVPWVFWNDKAGVWMSEFIQWNGNPIAWMPFPDEPMWADDESIASEETDG